MDEASLNTGDLHFWVLQLRAGDPDAAEPEFRKILKKVERLAAAAFGRFPRVGRFVELDDVIQNSLIRLLAALRDIRPDNTRQFYALANELIRRELLDLAKHFYGPRGEGTHRAAVAVGGAAGEVAPIAPADAAELDRLTAFHEAVARLPVEEREAVGLTYYHGWSQAEVAALLQVSVRTVRRWLESATAALRAELEGD